MFRRLFWLSALSGVGYVLWRWLRQQNESTPPPTSSVQPFTPAAPAPLGATEAPAAPSAGPRRIPTRVHRGAPPAREGDPQPPAAPDQPAQPAPDLADLVSPAADAPGDLSGLVGDAVTGERATLAGPAADALASLAGDAAAAPGDLAELVGDAVAGEGTVDLAPLVSPEAAAGAPSLGGPLTNINTADEEALIALPGIGPALARRIIAHRDEHGPFATIEALEAIQGIGPRNIEEFRHLVTV